MTSADATWISRLEGVVTAMVTPFTPAGELALDVIPQLVERQVAAGAAGLMACGTTGEFLALTPDERRAALEAFVQASDARLPVIVNVAHPDMRVARALARHAVANGAMGVSAITPYFYPVSSTAVLQAHRELAAEADGTAYLVYHFPRNTTNAFAPEHLGELLDLPNVVGIKCSVGSLDELEGFLQHESRVRVLSGNDSLMPGFRALGGEAIVSGNAAAFPEAVVGAWSTVRASGDLAPVRRCLSDLATASRGGAPDRLKASLRTRGYPVGEARIRTYTPADEHSGSAVAAEARLLASLEQSS